MAADRLRERLATSTDDWISTTVITLEEQTRAAITRLGQARTILNQVEPYLLLSSLFRFFEGWRVAPFEEETASLFDSLRKKKAKAGRLLIGQMPGSLIASHI